MTQTSPPAGGIGGRHHFLLRRLHSLTGIVPVGVFLMFHLFTNFQLATGTFQHEVEWIHSLPALLFAELVIWLSIAFHAGLGIVYTFVGAKPNAAAYPYGGNWRYSLQRITGIIALVFIVLHIATLRWRWDIGGWFTPFFVESPDGTPLATATTANALQHGWWVVALYLIGAFSAVFHWANGLWTAAITWGLVISVRAQKRWGGVCAAIGVVLAVFTTGAIYGALAYDVSEAEQEAIRQTIEARAAGEGSGHAGQAGTGGQATEVVEDR